MQKYKKILLILSEKNWGQEISCPQPFSAVFLFVIKLLCELYSARLSDDSDFYLSRVRHLGLDLT